jgi:hypothetical protein
MARCSRSLSLALLSSFGIVAQLQGFVHSGVLCDRESAQYLLTGEPLQNRPSSMSSSNILKDPNLCNGRYSNDNSPRAWRATSGPRTGARGESECAPFNVSVHEAVDAQARADSLLLPQHCIVLMFVHSMLVRCQPQQLKLVHWAYILTVG